MITKEIFFDSLLEKVPELNSVYEEHLSDYDELLPHVLMADITRFILDLLDKDHNQSNEEKISIFLRHFENALKLGDEEVKNIVVVSFLENLEQDSPSYDLLKSRFGKELQNSLRQIEDFYS